MCGIPRRDLIVHGGAAQPEWFELTIDNERTVSIPLGIVVAREEREHPWQNYTWSPAAVIFGAPDLPAP